MVRAHNVASVPLIFMPCVRPGQGIAWRYVWVVASLKNRSLRAWLILYRKGEKEFWNTAEYWEIFACLYNSVSFSISGTI